MWITKNDEILNFGLLKCFKTHCLGLQKRTPSGTQVIEKKVPWPVACPMGKMSSWQSNDNDKLLCTRYWAIPEIIHGVGIYGVQGYRKVILN